MKIEARSLQNSASKALRNNDLKTKQTKSRKLPKIGSQREPFGRPKGIQRTKVSHPIAVVGGPESQNDSKTTPQSRRNLTKPRFWKISAHSFDRCSIIVGAFVALLQHYLSLHMPDIPNTLKLIRHGGGKAKGNWIISAILGVNIHSNCTSKSIEIRYSTRKKTTRASEIDALNNASDKPYKLLRSRPKLIDRCKFTLAGVDTFSKTNPK